MDLQDVKMQKKWEKIYAPQSMQIKMQKKTGNEKIWPDKLINFRLATLQLKGLVTVVYFDKLLGAVCTRKLVETLFSWIQPWNQQITEKGWK